MHALTLVQYLCTGKADVFLQSFDQQTSRRADQEYASPPGPLADLTTEERATLVTLTNGSTFPNNGRPRRSSSFKGELTGGGSQNVTKGHLRNAGAASIVNIGAMGHGTC